MQFAENRNNYPAEELEKYGGKLVAWWPDGSRIVDADTEGVAGIRARLACSVGARAGAGARLRKARQPRAKARGRGKRAGMEFRIAAGKPAAVAALRRRLVGERREGDDLRAGRSPALDDVGIDEGKGRVAGERNASPGRPQR